MPKRSETTLTAAFCRSAKPGVEISPQGRPQFVRTAYPDHDVRGLELRVAASGEKSWSFRYRDKITGKQSRVMVGLFDPTVDSPADEPEEVRRLTLQGARSAARLLRAKVDAKADPAADLRVARNKAKAEVYKTMSELAEGYFTACENGTHRSGRNRKKAASTINYERWMWGKYLKARIGAEAPGKITRTRIKAILLEVLKLAPGQANKCRALLSQIFNFAADETEDDDQVPVNPVARVKKVAADNARTRRLSDGEMKLIWRALRDPSKLKRMHEDREEPLLVSKTVRLAIELCMVTLQRRAEVSGMQRSELDLPNKLWTIPEERAKGRVEHLVPLSDRAIVLIEEALTLQKERKKGESQSVFPSPYVDGPIGPGSLSHAMADITAAVGIQNAELRDLRRTGASGIGALGVPPFVVSKVLSHKDADGAAPITNRHYNLYAYMAEKRDALDRWAAKLDQLFRAEPAQGDTPKAA